MVSESKFLQQSFILEFIFKTIFASKFGSVAHFFYQTMAPFSLFYHANLNFSSSCIWFSKIWDERLIWGKLLEVQKLYFIVKSAFINKQKFARRQFFCTSILKPSNGLMLYLPMGLFELLWPNFSGKSVKTWSQMKLGTFIHL